MILLRMRTLRAFLITVSAYSLLMWLYVIVRILAINDQGCWTSEFIDHIPVTFWQLGIVAFITSGASMFGFLSLKEGAKHETA